MIPYHTIIPNSILPHQQTITSLPDTSSFHVHDKSDIHPLDSKISTSTSTSTSLPVTVDRSLAVSERAMSDETIFTKPAPPTRSDSSSGSSDEDRDLHDPVPLRPKFHSRKSSGTIIVSRDSRDSSDSGPVETRFAPNDVRSMSPRRTSRDLEIMGREAREELHRLVATPGSLHRQTYHFTCSRSLANMGFPGMRRHCRNHFS